MYRALPNLLYLRLESCVDAVTGPVSSQNIKKFLHETLLSDAYRFLRFIFRDYA